MCTVWHVDKYKITFKLVIISRMNLSRPGIIDARARYRAAARRLRNTDLEELFAIRETRATCQSMTFTGAAACQFWECKSEHNAYVKYAEAKCCLTYSIAVSEVHCVQGLTSCRSTLQRPQSWILIIILTIITFINCNWVVTRWQWLFYMYTKHEIGY